MSGLKCRADVNVAARGRPVRAALFVAPAFLAFLITGEPRRLFPAAPASVPAFLADASAAATGRPFPVAPASVPASPAFVVV